MNENRDQPNQLQLLKLTWFVIKYTYFRPDQRDALVSLLLKNLESVK